MSEVTEVEESESDVHFSNILMEEGIQGGSWVFSKVWPKVTEVEESDRSVVSGFLGSSSEVQSMSSVFQTAVCTESSKSRYRIAAWYWTVILMHWRKTDVMLWGKKRKMETNSEEIYVNIQPVTYIEATRWMVDLSGNLFISYQVCLSGASKYIGHASAGNGQAPAMFICSQLLWWHRTFTSQRVCLKCCKDDFLLYSSGLMFCISRLLYFKYEAHFIETVPHLRVWSSLRLNSHVLNSDKMLLHSMPSSTKFDQFSWWNILYLFRCLLSTAMKLLTRIRFYVGLEVVRYLSIENPSIVHSSWLIFW